MTGGETERARKRPAAAVWCPRAAMSAPPLRVESFASKEGSSSLWCSGARARGNNYNRQRASERVSTTLRQKRAGARWRPQ
uniref:Uncharacterized protein n=1 Tax=Setaria italica TaxID=4555 RepID=K3ZPJ9_SETIT